VIRESELMQNYCPFRISPEIIIAIGITAVSRDEEMPGQQAEMIASRHPRPDEMEAYERVLTDAMAGEQTLFAREDYVEEAWRIVDPAIKVGTPFTNINRELGGQQRSGRRCRTFPCSFLVSDIVGVGCDPGGKPSFGVFPLAWSAPGVILRWLVGWVVGVATRPRVVHRFPIHFGQRGILYRSL
jgi:glucose-6-phosphate dehydrogenase-like protein